MIDRYQLRIVTSHGNAFECLTGMTIDEVRKEINNAEASGSRAVFICLNEIGQEVILEIDSSVIEGIMHQAYVKPQIARPVLQ